MTRETADFLAKAHRLAADASPMLEAGFVEAAARTADLAGFHAAQALIFDQTGRVLKTHNGVQAEFARLVRDDGRFEARQRSFLSRTYEFKAIADYGVGADEGITSDETRDAIAELTDLIAAVEGALAPSP